MDCPHEGSVFRVVQQNDRPKVCADALHEVNLVRGESVSPALLVIVPQENQEHPQILAVVGMIVSHHHEVNVVHVMRPL